MQDMSWRKFIGKSRSLARDGMVFFFPFEPNEFERRFYSIICDLYPGYSYTGGSLAEIWLQPEILLPLQVLKSAQVAQALTKTQNIIQKKGSVPQ